MLSKQHLLRMDKGHCGYYRDAQGKLGGHLLQLNITVMNRCNSSKLLASFCGIVSKERIALQRLLRQDELEQILTIICTE